MARFWQKLKNRLIYYYINVIILLSREFYENAMGNSNLTKT